MTQAHKPVNERITVRALLKKLQTLRDDPYLGHLPNRFYHHLRNWALSRSKRVVRVKHCPNR